MIQKEKKEKQSLLAESMRLSRSPRCPSLRCSLLPRRRTRRPSCLTTVESSRDGERGARDLRDGDEAEPRSSLWPSQLLATAASGVALGPLCDSLHSRHGVLRYEPPTLRVDFLDLETTWWTPVLFAVAGVILGAGLPFLDEKLSASTSSASTSSPSSSPPPSSPPPAPSSAPDLFDRGWPLTLLSISAFVLIYFLSAVGGEQGQSPEWLPPALWLCSASLFAAADGTPQGLFLAAAAALAGPGVEFFLIEALHLYRYADESFLGTFPAWIAAVYFAGGPAVGALGRRVRAELVKKSGEKSLRER